jgi:hypothetical protein
MKKIYICGIIFGLPQKEVTAKFSKAEKYLTKQGFDVSPPLGTHMAHFFSLEFRMTKDILSLIGCDAVYLLPDWEHSEKSVLEKRIAELTGKELIYKKAPVFAELKQAIYEATGIAFYEIAGRNRSTPFVFARMIYAHFCKQQQADIGAIAREMRRNRNTVNYYLGKFADEMEYSRRFREMVGRVEGALKRETEKS